MLLRAEVMHRRRGRIDHGFRLGVDYLLLAPETVREGALFSRNRFNLLSLHDRDHGGPRGAGQGAQWARRVLAKAGLAEAGLAAPGAGLTLALLTQPRFLGYWFTPVSFWLAYRGSDLVAVIAEVNNTFGQRHSYLLQASTDFTPITPSVTLGARKIFHVSPFQDVAGDYRFRFDIDAERVEIGIRQIDGAEGQLAGLRGGLLPLRSRTILVSALRRPGGSLRVLALIYWNALLLKLKGARYRARPEAPDHEVSS